VFAAGNRISMEILVGVGLRAGLTGGDNGGNCPDDIYLFQIKYSFAKLS